LHAANPALIKINSSMRTARTDLVLKMFGHLHLMRQNVPGIVPIREINPMFTIIYAE
jgi:hypothetical protein